MPIRQAVLGLESVDIQGGHASGNGASDSRREHNDSIRRHLRLIVYDIKGDTQLTPGDKFLVYGMSESHVWRLQLYWAGTDMVEADGWST